MPPNRYRIQPVTDSLSIGGGGRGGRVFPQKPRSSEVRSSTSSSTASGDTPPALETINSVKKQSPRSVANSNKSEEMGKSRTRRSHSDIPTSVEATSSFPLPPHNTPPRSSGYSPYPYYGYPIPPPPVVAATGAPPLPVRDRSSSLDVGPPGHHYRSHSLTSDPMVYYGSMIDGPPPPPPPPHSGDDGSVNSDRRGSKFSPRAEIRKLTKGLSPITARRKMSFQNHTPPPPQHVRHGSNGSFQYAPNPYDSPVTSARKGGEAAYRSHKRRHSRTSQSRTHLRQQSVQVVMESSKGVPQNLVCRNVIFFLLFAFHLICLGFVGQYYAPEAFAEQDDDITIVYGNLVKIAGLSGIFSIVLSGMLLAIMTACARNFLQVALSIVIGISFIWGTVGIGVSPQTAVPITGILALAISISYTYVVWDRIPFHAANLHTALSAIRHFPSVLVVGFLFQVISLVYSVFFAIVACGVYDAIVDGDLEVSSQVAIVIYILLGISYLWTFQVLQGAVQAITAAVVDEWWHNPTNVDTVRESLFKTLFYSMGSVCFGSLFVGPVALLRQISVLFRPSSTENSSLLCVHECIHCVQTCLTSCVDSMAAAFSAWSYCYVGMYQYSFTEAGYGAAELFENRGWTTIVSDDLVSNIFLLTSLVVGGATGCAAYLVSQYMGLQVAVGSIPGLAPFVTGVVVGLVLPSIVFSVISSGMNAVLICFAASPVDFEENHPTLSQEMRAAWREVWPGALDTCDAMRFAAGGLPNHLSLSIRSYERANGQEGHPLLS